MVPFAKEPPVEAVPEEDEERKGEGDEIIREVQRDEGHAKRAIGNPLAGLAAGYDVLDDANAVLDQMPRLGHDESDQQEEIDRGEAPAVHRECATDVHRDVEQTREIEQIEEEMIPLDIQKPENAAGFLGGQAEMRKLVELRDVFDVMEDLEQEQQAEDHRDCERKIACDLGTACFPVWE